MAIRRVMVLVILGFFSLQESRCVQLVSMCPDPYLPRQSHLPLPLDKGNEVEVEEGEEGGGGVDSDDVGVVILSYVPSALAGKAGSDLPTSRLMSSRQRRESESNSSTKPPPKNAKEKLSLLSLLLETKYRYKRSGAYGKGRRKPKTTTSATTATRKADGYDAKSSEKTNVVNTTRSPGSAGSARSTGSNGGDTPEVTTRTKPTSTEDGQVAAPSSCVCRVTTSSSFSVYVLNSGQPRRGRHGYLGCLQIRDGCITKTVDLAVLMTSGSQEGVNETTAEGGHCLDDSDVHIQVVGQENTERLLITVKGASDLRVTCGHRSDSDNSIEPRPPLAIPVERNHDDRKEPSSRAMTTSNIYLMLVAFLGLVLLMVCIGFFLFAQRSSLEYRLGQKKLLKRKSKRRNDHNNYEEISEVHESRCSESRNALMQQISVESRNTRSGSIFTRDGDSEASRPGLNREYSLPDDPDILMVGYSTAKDAVRIKSGSPRLVVPAGLSHNFASYEDLPNNPDSRHPVPAPTVTSNAPHDSMTAIHSTPELSLGYGPGASDSSNHASSFPELVDLKRHRYNKKAKSEKSRGAKSRQNPYFELERQYHSTSLDASKLAICEGVINTTDLPLGLSDVTLNESWREGEADDDADEEEVANEEKHIYEDVAVSNGHQHGHHDVGRNAATGVAPATKERLNNYLRSMSADSKERAVPEICIIDVSNLIRRADRNGKPSRRRISKSEENVCPNRNESESENPYDVIQDGSIITDSRRPRSFRGAHGTAATTTAHADKKNNDDVSDVDDDDDDDSVVMIKNDLYQSWESNINDVDNELRYLDGQDDLHCPNANLSTSPATQLATTTTNGHHDDNDDDDDDDMVMIKNTLYQLSSDVNPRLASVDNAIASPEESPAWCGGSDDEVVMIVNDMYQSSSAVRDTAAGNGAEPQLHQEGGHSVRSIINTTTRQASLEDGPIIFAEHHTVGRESLGDKRAAVEDATGTRMGATDTNVRHLAINAGSQATDMTHATGTGMGAADTNVRHLAINAATIASPADVEECTTSVDVTDSFLLGHVVYQPTSHAIGPPTVMSGIRV